MKMEYRLIIAALAIFLVLTAALVSAYTVGITITNPSEAETVRINYTRSMDINATTNSLANGCWYKLSRPNLVGTNYTMTNTSSANNSWTATNSTFFTVEGVYNVTIGCYDSQTNLSQSELRNFTVETNYVVGINTSTLLNNSYKQMPFWLNVTLNDTARNIEAIIGNMTTKAIGDTLAMTNQSLDNKTFSLNVSSMWGNSTYLEDNGNFNITLRIYDTGISKEATNYTYNFTIDRTAPTFADIKANYTTDGKISVDFNITENYPLNCSAVIYSVNKTKISEVAGTLSTSGSQTRNCLVNITSASSEEGQLIFEPNAYDQAAQIGKGANQTNWIMQNLYSGWNLLGTVDNETLGRFAGRNEYIDYLDIYNNTNLTGYFTLYTKVAGTNNLSVAQYGEGLYVSVTQTTALFRKINETLTAMPPRNVTVVDPWSLVAPQNTSATLYQHRNFPLRNATQATGMVIPKYITTLDSSAAAGSQWITYVSRNTTGNPQDYVLTIGRAIWVSQNDTAATDVSPVYWTVY